MEYEEAEYEAIDFDNSSSVLPPPLKGAELLSAIKKSVSLDSGGKPLPPSKLRRNGAPPPPLSKNRPPIPPPTANRGVPPSNAPPTAPRPLPPTGAPPPGSRSLPSNAPPVGKKPPPVGARKKSETVPKSRPTRAASEDTTALYGNQVTFSPPPISTPCPVKMGEEEGDGETLVLADLVRKHSKELPLRVRVDEGYCGVEERFVISAGDIYNFHFVKNEKVVSVQDCGGTHFSIPYNSEIKFGLLYNPNNDFKEALDGYVFMSVSELVSLSQTPRLVKVIECPTSPTRRMAEKNELLVIKKTGKTMLRKSFMKVYSLKTKEEKTLYDDCDCKFTTDPTGLRLYIPELMELFPDSFPLEAMMYPPGEDTDDLPTHLTTDVVSLTHTSIESAIIATTYWGDEDAANLEDEEQTPISIPIEMDIEVTILKDTDEDELYQDTKTLLVGFDLSKVKDMKNDGRENELERENTGRKLHHRVRKGYEFRGVDLTVSHKLLSDPGLPTTMPFRRAVNTPLPPTPDELSAPPTNPRPVSPAKKYIDTPDNKMGRYGNINKSGDRNNASTAKTGEGGPPLPPVRGQSRDDNSNPSPSPRPPRKPRSKTFGAVDNVYNDENPDDDYENSDGNLPLVAPPPLPPPLSPSHSSAGSTGKNTQENNASPGDITDLKGTVKFLQSLVDVMQENFKKEISIVKEEVTSLTATVEELREMCSALQPPSPARTQSPTAADAPRVPPRPPSKKNSVAESSQPRSSPVFPPSPSPVLGAELTKTADPEKQKENVADLRAMGVQEILYLLDIMKLSQYKEMFLEENIDGEILAECDDPLLEQELHISNKLHRNRLMKVITGRHSAHCIKHGLDPYGGQS